MGEKIILRDRGQEEGVLLYINTVEGKVRSKVVDICRTRPRSRPSERISGYLRELVDTGKIQYINKGSRGARELNLVVGREGEDYIVHNVYTGVSHKSVGRLLEEDGDIQVMRELVGGCGRKGDEVSEILRGIEKELGGTLCGTKEVREELFNRTGVLVKVRSIGQSVVEVGVYLSGATMEELSLDLGEVEKLKIKILDGKVQKLKVEGEITELILDIGTTQVKVEGDTLSEEAGNLGVELSSVELGRGVVKYNTYTQARYLLGVQEGSKLKELVGYNGTVADLREARNLVEIRRCFKYTSEERVPIAIKYPEGVRFMINDSYHNVNLMWDGLVRKGVLDLDNKGSILGSFSGFIGVENIRGRVEGGIRNSFIGGEYSGYFEVEAREVFKSFCTLGKVGKKSKAEGRIRLYPKVREVTTNVDSGYTNVEYWEQTIEVLGEVGVLNVVLDKAVKVVIRSKVYMLNVEGKSEYYDNLKVEYRVKRLVKTVHPYSNVEEYGRDCFRIKGAFTITQKTDTQMKDKNIVELPEGLEYIGDRVFSKVVLGPRYMVIPRSCTRLGVWSFDEFKTQEGLPVTICVYKGSEGAKLLKGRGLKLRVIESVEELEREFELDSDLKETEGMYGLLDMSGRYGLSRRFLYNLGQQEIEEYTSNFRVVGNMPGELQELLKTLAKDTSRRYVGIGGKSIPEEYEEILVGGLTGSDMGLLSRSVVNNCDWEVREFKGIVKYIGKQKLYDITKDKDIVIYMKQESGEVYYVGCPVYTTSGGLQDNKVYKGVEVVTEDLKNNMILRYIKEENSQPAREEEVYGDVLEGSQKDLMESYISTNWLKIDEYVHSDLGMQVYYDYIEDKVYEFRGTILKSVEAEAEIVRLEGIHRGEDWLKLEDNVYKGIVKKIEVNKKLQEEYKEAKGVRFSYPSSGGVSEEIEYLLGKGKELMEGGTLNIEYVEEFLEGSQLVKKLSKKELSEYTKKEKELVLESVTGRKVWEVVDKQHYMSTKIPNTRNILVGYRADSIEVGYKVGFDVFKLMRSYGRGERTGVVVGDRFCVEVEEKDIVDVWGTNRIQRGGPRLFLGLDKVTGKVLLVYAHDLIFGTRKEMYMSLWAFESVAKGIEYMKKIGCPMYGKEDKKVYYIELLTDVDTERGKVLILGDTEDEDTIITQRTLKALGCPLEYTPRNLDTETQYDKIVIDYARV